MVHLQDAGDQPAQEGAVVRDHDQRAPVLHQGARQRFGGDDVQVVGGLVEQQQVDRLQQQPRQRHAHALAAGQHAHRLVDVIRVEQEGAQQVADLLLLVGCRRGMHGLQHRESGIELPLLVLREVGLAQAHRPPDRAGARLLRAGQGPHQRGLARAVLAHHGQPVVALHLQVDSRVHLQVAVAPGQPGAGQRHPAAARRIGQRQLDGRRLHGPLAARQLLQVADPALHQPRLGGGGAKAADERLDPFDLFLLQLVRLGVGADLLGPRPLEVGVAARIGAQPAVADLQHALAAAVQELPVVGDHHEAAVAPRQEALQPFARRQVQVVGGLVEEQQVGAAQQHPSQRDPHLPAAGQLADRPVAVRLLETQAAHDDADLAVAFVVAAALQPFEALPVRGEHLLAGISVGHAPLQRLGLGRHRVQVAEGPLQLLDDRPPRPGRGVAGPGLGQVAHARAALQAHAAGVRGKLAGGHAQQRALAAAVGTGQRDTVSPGQRGAGAGEHGLRAVGHADPFQGDGSHAQLAKRK